MIIKTLYRFRRPDGGVTDTLTKPEGEYIERVRIIADENKLLTKDNKEFYSVIDADTTDGWYEVDIPTEETSEATE